MQLEQSYVYRYTDYSKISLNKYIILRSEVHSTSISCEKNNMRNGNYLLKSYHIVTFACVSLSVSVHMICIQMQVRNLFYD